MYKNKRYEWRRKPPALNNDVLTEIFLNSDIVDIKNVCLTNKNINNIICKNKNFWIKKFEKDDLPFLQFDTTNYIKEYQYVSSFKDAILQFLSNYNLNNTGFKLNVESDYKMRKYLPEGLSPYGDWDIIYNPSHYLLYGDNIEVIYREYNDRDKLIDSDVYYISIEEFITILIAFYYYYPNKDVVYL